jgi:hypothetical protein
MNPTESLAEKVRSKRDELMEAERHVEVLKAELRAWEEAWGMVTGHPSGGRQSTRPSSRVCPDRRDVRRGPTSDWKSVLIGMANKFPPPVVFGLDDLERVSIEVGVPKSKDVIKSQMANYSNSGMVERVERGRFRITEVCLNAIGLASKPGLDNIGADYGVETEAAAPVTETAA